MPKKDNAGFREKIALRERALSHVGTALVPLDAYAGAGAVGATLYASASTGSAFEKDPAKCEQLVRQRPSWRVYQGDTIGLLAAGIACPGTNYVDLDPYGDPWVAADALFYGKTDLAPRLVVAVNDGLRQKVKMGGAWSCNSLSSVVRTYGADLYASYLDVCRHLMEQKARERGYALAGFEGFYGGHAKQMTHYYAVLQQR